jgi:hypothetical protein
MEIALTMTKIEFVGTFLPEAATQYRIQSLYAFEQIRDNMYLKEFHDQPGYSRLSAASTWHDVYLALEDGGSPEFMGTCARMIEDSLPCTLEELHTVTIGIDKLIQRKLEVHQRICELMKQLLG